MGDRVIGAAILRALLRIRVCLLLSDLHVGGERDPINLRLPVPSVEVPVVAGDCRLGRGIGGEAGVEAILEL